MECILANKSVNAQFLTELLFHWLDYPALHTAGDLENILIYVRTE